LGGYGERSVNLGASLANGRFFGDRIREDRRVVQVRHVDGLEPWERAAWIAKRESADREVRSK
jgi:hypothetical protein